jgi:hypothetical protein
MPVDDEAARKARAQRLREQIKQIESPKTEDESTAKEARPQPGESPRDFIHRKMRELDKKDGA